MRLAIFENGKAPLGAFRLDNGMYVFSYQSKEGQRIDSIAYLFYEDATLIRPILEVNSDLILKESLDGEKVIVPIVERKEKGNKRLPPWRR